MWTCIWWVAEGWWPPWLVHRSLAPMTLWAAQGLGLAKVLPQHPVPAALRQRRWVGAEAARSPPACTSRFLQAVMWGCPQPPQGSSRPFQTPWLTVRRPPGTMCCPGCCTLPGDCQGAPVSFAVKQTNKQTNSPMPSAVYDSFWLAKAASHPHDLPLFQAQGLLRWTSTG